MALARIVTSCGPPLAVGTAAEWAAANPILFKTEVGLESDTGMMKVGDGTTAYASLPVLPRIYSATTGPILTDDTDGHTYRIGSHNGAITLTQVT